MNGVKLAGSVLAAPLILAVAMAFSCGSPRLCSAQPEDGGEATPARQDAESAQAESEPATENAPDADASAASAAHGAIPTLQQMLDIALEHNPDVRAADAQVRVSEAELDRTRLQVVQKIVAYRERWKTQRAEVDLAEEHHASLLSQTKHDSPAHDPRTNARIRAGRIANAKHNLAFLRQRLSELEAELPFLLGRSLPVPHQEVQPAASLTRARMERRKAEPAIRLKRVEMGTVLKRLLDATWANYRAGRASLEQIYDWSRRLMQVELNLAETGPERIAAIERHRDVMSQLHHTAEALREVGRRGSAEVLSTEVYLAEAELLLLEERGE